MNSITWGAITCNSFSTLAHITPNLQGITTAVAMQQGFGSPLFAACLCFSVIVMYDAMGVRRHAGKQAEVLNKVINELLEDHPVGEIKLKEVLGHTPRQVETPLPTK